MFIETGIRKLDQLYFLFSTVAVWFSNFSKLWDINEKIQALIFFMIIISPNSGEIIPARFLTHNLCPSPKSLALVQV